MDYQKLILDQRKSFNEQCKSFLKEDFKYATNKAKFNEKRVGVFTRAYYKRKKLIQLGTLTYGYVFRIREQNSSSQPTSTWLLFSPQAHFEKNPAIYEKTMQNISKIAESRVVEKKYKRLKIMISEPYAEPSYFPVPAEFCDNNILYISHVYYWKEKNPHFHLGITPIFISQNITKEIIYLPERYWTNELKDFLLKK